MHLAIVGSGVACQQLRGRRTPGEQFVVPYERTWCWETAADNPPNCFHCAGIAVTRTQNARRLALLQADTVARFDQQRTDRALATAS